MCKSTSRIAIYIWFINPDIENLELEKRTFIVHMPGRETENIKGDYIGTFLESNDTIVGHVFEEK